MNLPFMMEPVDSENTRLPRPDEGRILFDPLATASVNGGCRVCVAGLEWVRRYGQIPKESELPITSNSEWDNYRREAITFL